LIDKTNKQTNKNETKMKKKVSNKNI